MRASFLFCPIDLEDLLHLKIKYFVSFVEQKHSLLDKKYFFMLCFCILQLYIFNISIWCKSTKSFNKEVISNVPLIG